MVAFLTCICVIELSANQKEKHSQPQHTDLHYPSMPSSVSEGGAAISVSSCRLSYPSGSKIRHNRLSLRGHPSPKPARLVEA